MAVSAIPVGTPRRGAERARTARLIHESLGLLSSKWAVDVLLALGDGTRRYHQLLADLEPISEKVLTQTCARWSATAGRAPRATGGPAARRVRADAPGRDARRAAAGIGRLVGGARQARRGGARPVRGAGAGEDRGVGWVGTSTAAG